MYSQNKINIETAEMNKTFLNVSYVESEEA